MRRSTSRRRGPRLLPLLVGLAACDVPTQVPQWDTLWVIPGDSTVIEAGSFFPSGVHTAPGGDAFLVSLPAVDFERTLGQMCGAACQAADGATVPKPAFEVTLSSTSALPADVLSATISGGRVELRLSHDFPFDPIRPSASARGSIVITLTSGATTLARDSISGAGTAWAPGTVLTRTLALGAGTVSGPVSINVTVGSPAGDRVRVDTDDRITVSATLPEVRASQAQVRLSGSRAVAGEEAELELGGVDAELVERIERGVLRLRVDNPFEAEGTLRLAFRQVGSGPFDKAVRVGPGEQRLRIELSADEIRALLDSDEVTVTPSGTFSAPDGIITIRPAQAIGVESELELVVGIGG